MSSDSLHTLNKISTHLPDSSHSSEILYKNEHGREVIKKKQTAAAAMTSCFVVFEELEKWPVR
jgi:hypothetical protein